MILETIFSTVDAAGRPNFAPMGLGLNGGTVAVRPYRNTRTCENLLSSGYGVANVTDDVLAYVQTCFYNAVLPNFPAEKIRGVVYKNTCSWMELEVLSEGGNDSRADFKFRTVYIGRMKDFTGFCRAGNAVIEASILATRVALNNPARVEAELNRYEEIVEKTGGDREREAMRLIREHVRRGSDD